MILFRHGNRVAAFPRERKNDKEREDPVMKPFFSNAFGVARNANQEGRTVELQLDFRLQYTEGDVILYKKSARTEGRTKMHKKYAVEK